MEGSNIMLFVSPTCRHSIEIVDLIKTSPYASKIKLINVLEARTDSRIAKLLQSYGITLVPTLQYTQNRRSIIYRGKEEIYKCPLTYGLASNPLQMQPLVNDWQNPGAGRHGHGRGKKKKISPDMFTGTSVAEILNHCHRVSFPEDRGACDAFNRILKLDPRTGIRTDGNRSAASLQMAMNKYRKQTPGLQNLRKGRMV